MCSVLWEVPHAGSRPATTKPARPAIGLILGQMWVYWAVVLYSYVLPAAAYQEDHNEISCATFLFLPTETLILPIVRCTSHPWDAWIHTLSIWQLS